MPRIVRLHMVKESDMVIQNYRYEVKEKLDAGQKYSENRLEGRQ